MEDVIKLIIGNSPQMFVFLYFAYKMDKRLTVLEIKEELRNGNKRKKTVL